MFCYVYDYISCYCPSNGYILLLYVIIIYKSIDTAACKTPKKISRYYQSVEIQGYTIYFRAAHKSPTDDSVSSFYLRPIESPKATVRRNLNSPTYTMLNLKSHKVSQLKKTLDIFSTSWCSLRLGTCKMPIVTAHCRVVAIMEIRPDVFLPKLVSPAYLLTLSNVFGITHWTWYARCRAAQNISATG